MIGIGVLGCGRIGLVHAKNAARSGRVRLVSVFDPVAGEAVASELGCAAAASAEAVLADPAVRGVVIATPTPSHVDLIVASVAAGKAVLCEKPIGLDMARVRWCAAQVAGAAVPILIGFNRRFDPSFRALRQRVAAGEIGAVEQVVITSRDPAPPPPSYVAGSGGLFRDMTIHDFDMARYLAGEMAEVRATGSNLVDPAIGAAGDLDGAVVTMRAVSGALVVIVNSRRCAYGYDQRVEVFGSAGMLEAGNWRETTVRSWGAARTGAGDRVLDFFIERYAAAYRAELDHFVDLIEGRAELPLAGFADGVRALELAELAQAAVTGGGIGGGQAVSSAASSSSPTSR